MCNILNITPLHLYTSYTLRTAPDELNLCPRYMIFCIGGLDLSRVSAIPQNPERSPDSVTSSVPRAAAWLLYQPSRLPRLEARAACGALVVRIKIGFRV